MHLQQSIDLSMKVGIHMHLHSDSICTACQYLHRLEGFLKEGHQEESRYDPGVVVTTALYIACKANENHVRLSELISSVHYHLTNQNIDYDHYELLPKDGNYWKLRDSVLQFELFMLRTLQFKLSIDLPHKYQIFYLKTLSDWIHNPEKMDQLFQLCWSLLNDYSCKLSLAHPDRSPTQIALITIDIALKMIDKSNQVMQPNHIALDWYTHFDKTLTLDIAHNIRTTLLDIYNPLLQSQ